MKYPYEGWKNKGGTNDRLAPCGSWKRYWQKNTEEAWPYCCCVLGCNRPATDGAHMYCPSVNREEYIIPTCHYHNMQYGSIYDLKHTLSSLVSANVNT